MPLLEIVDASVTLPAPGGRVSVVENFGLTIDAAERVGLVGESGCGKSMAALAIMGLLPAGAELRGRVLFDGIDLGEQSERDYCRVRGRRIAMVFQEPMTALNPVQSIGAQVAEGIRWHLRVPRDEAASRADYWLDRVGLPRARFSPRLYPHQLSGGQRQRVVLASALACEPELLIADEPTTALDVMVQAEILRLIADACTDSGMGLLLITHDLAVVATTTDRVNVMYAGRVVEQGASESLFDQMAHPYTRGLAAAMPQWVARPAGGRNRLATIGGVVPDPAQRPPGCVFSDRCGYTQARCSEQTPLLSRVAADHNTACHFPLS